MHFVLSASMNFKSIRLSIRGWVLSELKACPCGEIPEFLHIRGDSREKWSFVSGGCCNGWHIEFRSNYEWSGSEECKQLAIKAWNAEKRVGGES